MKQAQTGTLTGIPCTGQAVSSTSQVLSTTDALNSRRQSCRYEPPFDWAPCSPVDGLSHYLLVGRRLVACHHGASPSEKDKVHSFSLPAPPDAQLPLTNFWHTWCWDAAQHLHLVFACDTVAHLSNRKLLKPYSFLLCSLADQHLFWGFCEFIGRN